MGAQYTVANPLADGTSYHAASFNDLVEQMTATGIGSSGELDASVIESGVVVGGVTGSAATTSGALRKLGTGANDACAGNDSRLSGVAPFAAQVVFGWTGSAIVVTSQTNVASVVRTSTGLYAITFTTAIPAWPCGVIIQTAGFGSGYGIGTIAMGLSPSTSAVSIITSNSLAGASFADVTYCSVLFLKQ